MSRSIRAESVRRARQREHEAAHTETGILSTVRHRQTDVYRTTISHRVRVRLAGRHTAEIRSDGHRSAEDTQRTHGPATRRASVDFQTAEPISLTRQTNPTRTLYVRHSSPPLPPYTHKHTHTHTYTCF